MTFYIKRGSSFMVAAEADMDIHYTLPVGTYIISQNPMTGEFFFEVIDNFKAIPKYYGDTLKNTARILNTFNDRDNATGVILTGEKGSGKTLLSKSISIEGAKVGVPTIVINKPLIGDAFNAFIQKIDQACIIIFDEFEKVFDEEAQELILTLLDGVFPSKKLFILTCNDVYRTNYHMKNRPGRIYYYLEFEGLDPEFIHEYCTDNLNNKSHIETIINISTLFHQFNFDMLKALVEEMNRYDESPQDAIKLLNAKPENDSGRSTYTVELKKNGRILPENELHTRNWTGSPISRQRVSIEYLTLSTDENEDDEYHYATFESEDLTNLDGKAGIYRFEKDEFILTLTKQKSDRFDYTKFI